MDGTIATRGRTLDGGGFDATLSVPTLTGTLRGRTLDGKAEFTAQGETYRGTANLTLDSGNIDIEGDAGTAPRLHWDARATLDGFDAGFFVDGWTGAVEANIDRKGGAREDDGYDATVDIPHIGGQLRGRPLAGHAPPELTEIGRASGRARLCLSV